MLKNVWFCDYAKKLRFYGLLRKIKNTRASSRFFIAAKREEKQSSVLRADKFIKKQRNYVSMVYFVK